MATASVEHKEFEHEATSIIQNPLAAQGTITYNIQRKTPFQIRISRKKPTAFNQWVALEIGQNYSLFKLGSGGKDPPKVLCKEEKVNVGFEQDSKESYWFSYDREHLVLKYGKGYIMEQTTLMVYDFLKDQPNPDEIYKKYSYIFAPYYEKQFELHDFFPKEQLVNFYAAHELSMLDLTSYNFTIGGKDGKIIDEITRKIKGKNLDKPTLERVKEMIDSERRVTFYPCPLTVNWPHLVLASSKLTLFELDSYKCIFSASLPPTCRELYANVFQTNIDLDWPNISSEDKLSDAMTYSINTKGKILYKSLNSKDPQMGKFVVVGFGPSHGDSPGVPFVMNIFPAGFESLVHDHAGTYAIIHVLHGTMTITSYNKSLEKGGQELDKFDVKKGEVTWISPNWYQTHKVSNEQKDFNATIECYQYGLEDTLKWPLIEIIDEKDNVMEFRNDYDFRFIELREMLMKEYSERDTTQ